MPTDDRTKLVLAAMGAAMLVMVAVQAPSLIAPLTLGVGGLVVLASILKL
ncbi:hypothetical protein ACFVZD_36750 [Streptomyces sp. NPDC058287]